MGVGCEAEILSSLCQKQILYNSMENYPHQAPGRYIKVIGEWLPAILRAVIEL